VPVPDWVKHAFAVDAGPATPTPEQAELVQRLCHEVVRRGMTVPAITMLEMSHPLSYVAAQAMHFFAPVISSLFDGPAHRILAEFLEQRGAVEYVCSQLEDLQKRNDAGAAARE
jgi:hypothetical protein